MKSAVDQKDLKLGVVITWVISIVQKNIVATATCLERVDLLTLAVERVYRVSLKIILLQQTYTTKDIGIPVPSIVQSLIIKVSNMPGILTCLWKVWDRV